MSTPFKPELSKNNPYHLSSHRHYELRHMCRQYKEWKEELRKLDGYSGYASFVNAHDNTALPGDPTGETVMLREIYANKIKMVEEACYDAEPLIAKYLLIGATEGLTYDFIRARYEIPCGRDYYYDRFHKMFYILHTRNLQGSL